MRDHLKKMVRKILREKKEKRMPRKDGTGPGGAGPRTGGGRGNCPPKTTPTPQRGGGRGNGRGAGRGNGRGGR